MADDIETETETESELRPGDVAVFAVGFIAVIWALWMSSTWLAVVGLAVVVVGLVGPLRSLGRRVGR